MKIDMSVFFKEVTLRVCSSLDIEKALAQTLDYMHGFIPVDAMVLVYMDMAQKRQHRVARVERSGARFFADRGGWEADIDLDEEYISQFIKEGQKRGVVFMYNRPQQLPPAVLGNFPQLEDCSTLRLLLNIADQMIGELVIFARGHDRYTHEHKALIEGIKEPFAIAMSNARRYEDLMRVKDILAEDHRALAADIKRSAGIEVVGADFGLREVMKLVRQIATSSSPALLLGETGTGKEVIAHAIHMASPRHAGPMISMQCGAVPDTLLDSELFGHEKGAFTGAVERKRGRFERADKGTLFLDEVGELSAEAQIKLLRVLQEKRFERVGGTRTIKVDVRVVAATHRDLDKMVREGRFREDLWYRLNVLPIRIPPLRLRREDIPPLVQYFVERKVQEMSLQLVPLIDSTTLDRLKAYDWPGNVRELQNVVERALILSQGSYLIFPELNTLPNDREDQPLVQSPAQAMTMDQAMANHIRQVLQIAKGQIAGNGGAAELLKVNESTLRFRMKKLGIKRRRSSINYF